MALNTSKSNHLTQLRFKGLNTEGPEIQRKHALANDGDIWSHISQSDVLVVEQNSVVRRVDNGSGQLQLNQLLMRTILAGRRRVRSSSANRHHTTSERVDKHTRCFCVTPLVAFQSTVRCCNPGAMIFLNNTKPRRNQYRSSNISYSTSSFTGNLLFASLLADEIKSCGKHCHRGL